MASKDKWLRLIMFILLCLLGIQTKNYLDSRHQLNSLRTLEQEALALISQMEDYYINPETGFLKTSLDSSDLGKFDQAIQNLKERGPITVDLTHSFQRLASHYQAQQALNSLYDQTFLHGDQLNKEAHLKPNLSLQQLTKVRQEIFFTKADDAFENQINFQLVMLESQLKHYQSAIAQLEYLQHIPILVDNYALIARSFKIVESNLDQVDDQTLKDTLHAEIDTYLERFFQEAGSQWQAFPEDYLADQLIYSDYLSTGFQALQDTGNLHDQEKAEDENDD